MYLFPCKFLSGALNILDMSIQGENYNTSMNQGSLDLFSKLLHFKILPDLQKVVGTGERLAIYPLSRSPEY
jgi:hypothetical protein